MKNLRRIMFIAELIFFLVFLGLAVPQKSPALSYLQLGCFLIWSLLLLVHIFWFNRKSVFAYFSRVPQLSKRGLRQIIILFLAVIIAGIVTMSLPVVGLPFIFPEIIATWLPLVLAVVILAHVWLNRKTFFYYLGKKTGLVTWLFGWLLLVSGIVLRLYYV